MTAKKRFLGLTIVVALVAIISTPTAYFQRQARLNALCESNLKQINAAFLNYAHEAKGNSYPQLSSEPGRIMFSANGFVPNYLNDARSVISPFHPERKNLLRSSEEHPQSVVDDSSYWYPGYIFANEASALRWIDDYKVHVTQGSMPEEVNEVLPEYAGIVAARIESIRRSRGAGPDDVLMINRPVELSEMFACLKLRSGMARFLLTEINNPAISDVYIKKILPILIERPELHGNGGHVLYMDGHVAFVPYPGPFPMTKAFIEGLRSLDELEK